jgi:hypothetical protein
MALSGFCSWNDVDDSKTSGQSSFLRLQSGKEYTIRPVHKMVRFFKYFYKNNGQLRTAIVADPTTCTVPGKHPEAALKPTERYAFLAFDRADGKLKILEVPKSAIANMVTRAKRTKIECGASEKAWDWYVSVEGSGKETKYKADPADQVNLTKEEMDICKKFFYDATTKTANMNKLLDMYKACASDAEIEQKLFGPPVDKKSGAKKTVTVEVKQEAFGDGDTEISDNEASETSEGNFDVNF